MGKSKYKKEDYAVNPVFAAARIQLSLYASEGASLHKVASLAKAMQDSIVAAYQLAIREMGDDIIGRAGLPPFNLSDDNPFTGDLDE